MKVIFCKKKEFECNCIFYFCFLEYVGLLLVVMIVFDDIYLVSEGSEV